MQSWGENWKMKGQDSTMVRREMSCLIGFRQHFYQGAGNHHLKKVEISYIEHQQIQGKLPYFD